MSANADTMEQKTASPAFLAATQKATNISSTTRKTSLEGLRRHLDQSLTTLNARRFGTDTIPALPCAPPPLTSAAMPLRSAFLPKLALCLTDALCPASAIDVTAPMTARDLRQTFGPVARRRTGAVGAIITPPRLSRDWATGRCRVRRPGTT